MREQYQGKRLALLLLALCLPAALLYLRLVLGLAAADSHVNPAQSAVLTRWSYVALALFFGAQALSAGYLQKAFFRGAKRLGKTFQFAGMFLFGLTFSLVGAITLEGFGWNLFLRIAGRS